MESGASDARGCRLKLELLPMKVARERRSRVHSLSDETPGAWQYAWQYLLIAHRKGQKAARMLNAKFGVANDGDKSLSVHSGKHFLPRSRSGRGDDGAKSRLQLEFMYL
jgi:hypothetical protein